MRDRLIKLLCGVECDGEEQFGNCPQRRDGKCRTVQKLEMCQIGAIADHLLANGVIVPPCKVGDTVYRISKRYGEWCVLPRTVCSIKYSLDSHGNIAWYLFTTAEDRVGETVFLTREEAERALKGEHNG